MSAKASGAGLAAAGVCSAAAFALGDAYAACLASLPGTWTQNLQAALFQMPAYVLANAGGLLERGPLLAGFVCAVLVWVAWSQMVLRSGSFRRGEEHGSAAFLSPREAARRFSDVKDADNNIILTRHVGLAVDQSGLKPANRRAKNVLVVGGTGSGKTFRYVIPNALQLNQDFLFTDTKGDLAPMLGPVLRAHGYRVTVFDTKSPETSAKYNMLAYLRTPMDVIVFVRALVSVTSGESAKKEEAFWTDTTVLLLLAMTGYLVFHCRPEDRNLEGLILLLTLAQASEEDEGFTSPFELLMREIETGCMLRERAEGRGAEPGGRRAYRSRAASRYVWERVGEPVEPVDDFCLLCWSMLKAAAGKTLKSVIVSANARFEPMMVPEMRELTARDEMGLDRFGSAGAKHAVFAVTSDTTDAFSFLMAMMVWQTVHLSTERADRDHGGSLPRPLHLMCDEFYNLGRLSEMDHVVTTIRSRNISMSILLQSVAQLKARYGEEEAQVIMDNCDTLVYMGGKSTETNRMVSEMAGKQTLDVETWNVTRGEHGSWTRNRQLVERDLVQASEAGKLDRSKAIVLIAGADPIVDEKYDGDRHPRWGEIAACRAAEEVTRRGGASK